MQAVNKNRCQNVHQAIHLCTFAPEFKVSVDSDSKGNTGESPGQSRCCISQISVQDEQPYSWLQQTPLVRRTGKVSEPRDKSEDLPGISSFASAPRMGGYDKDNMSEIIEDSTELSGVLLRVSVCENPRTVRESHPYLTSRQEVILENVLKFDTITCLIAACPQAGFEWGGREVSPSYRKFIKTPYRTIRL